MMVKKRGRNRNGKRRTTLGKERNWNQGKGLGGCSGEERSIGAHRDETVEDWVIRGIGKREIGLEEKEDS